MSRDGGSTKIAFDLGGERAEASFPAPQEPGAPGRLQSPHLSFSLEVTRGTVPTGLSFFCR